MKTFIGGIGCFWDETKYKDISGVISTECGYCGGDEPNVTYKAVCGGDTGHIEVVKVKYDEKIKSYEDMVRLFFELHDSTQVNRQGTYVGIQYRSEIFYNNEEERKIEEKVLNEMNNKLGGKVSTKVSKEKNYSKAENYHQKYEENKSLKFD